VTIVLGQGLFGSGQSSLSTAARNDIRRLGAILSQAGGRTIAVEGHTDSSGAAASNQRLSEERAQAVREALVAGGVESARITAAGYGPSRPVADNASPAGRTQNRRVEIVLLGMRAPDR
jgi:outer membrane protein OmpA-like peptidoglycan-associated protein